MSTKKKYKRHLSRYQITRENSEERTQYETELIKEFFQLYEVEKNLNIKIPRVHFEKELDIIGTQLQRMANKIADNSEENPFIHNILQEYPVPEISKESLPQNFRVFCMLLNALKQWVSAEQAATDRVLLGGRNRDKLKQHIKKCVVSNDILEYDKKGAVNFHHTMRDGRFPIPLTKAAHDKIEGQIKKANKLSSKA